MSPSDDVLPEGASVDPASDRHQRARRVLQRPAAASAVVAIVCACATALSEETSPYLLQHADNPVTGSRGTKWRSSPRGSREQADPALGRLLRVPLVPRDGARIVRGRRHGAAHERSFVNMKVDREERPDIDKIYQTAHQLYTGRAGGWPLTVFLTPDEHCRYSRARISRRSAATACRRFARCSSRSRTTTARKARRSGAAARAWSRRFSEIADRQRRRFRRPLARAARAARGNASVRATTASTAVSATRRSSRTRPISICCSRTGAAHPAQARPTRRALAMVAHTLESHGARRSLRSARRRVLPLQRRSALVDPALREDAL